MGGFRDARFADWALEFLVCRHFMRNVGFGDIGIGVEECRAKNTWDWRLLMIHDGFPYYPPLCSPPSWFPPLINLNLA